MDEEWGNTPSPCLVYIPTYLAENRGEGWVDGWVGCEGLFFASAPFTSLLIQRPGENAENVFLLSILITWIFEFSKKKHM